MKTMSNNKQSSVEWLVEQIKKDINLRLRGFDIDKALGISIPQAEWVKTMKKAFKETTLGHNAFGIEVTYAIKE